MAQQTEQPGGSGIQVSAMHSLRMFTEHGTWPGVGARQSPRPLPPEPGNETGLWAPHGPSCPEMIWGLGAVPPELSPLPWVLGPWVAVHPPFHLPIVPLLHTPGCLVRAWTQVGNALLGPELRLVGCSVTQILMVVGAVCCPEGQTFPAMLEEAPYVRNCTEWVHFHS